MSNMATVLVKGMIMIVTLTTDLDHRTTDSLGTVTKVAMHVNTT